MSLLKTKNEKASSPNKAEHSGDTVLAQPLMASGYLGELNENWLCMDICPALHSFVHAMCHNL